MKKIFTIDLVKESGKKNNQQQSVSKSKYHSSGSKDNFRYLNKNIYQETSFSNQKCKINPCTSGKSIKYYQTNNTIKNRHLITEQKNNKENKQFVDCKKHGYVIRDIRNKIVNNQDHHSKRVPLGSQQRPNQQIKQLNLFTKSAKNLSRLGSETKRNIHNFNKQSRNQKSEALSLDMFQLSTKLGKGRFGDVYMAREISTGFVLAIKMISKLQLKKSDLQNQLIQQIKIQMFLNHPNVLKMYGFFSDHKNIYLLLQISTNGCLFKEIYSKTYLSEDEACYYFKQVCSGVKYLHSHYILHRDIKPENILNCFNVLKICDFGWAIYSPIYQRQTFCGTLDYVPPQIIKGQFYDQKADIWCLGVLCYQLCTGKAPFESKINQRQTYNKILKVQIQFPIYLTPKVVDLIEKILSKDPQQRITLQQIEKHEWIRVHQNELGRMVCKQIWNSWIRFLK